MGPADKLRAKADLFRRAAAHPTEGGKKTDRILLAMAERLEREAAEARQQQPGLDAGAPLPAS
jgi:hypothetical protein